MVRAGGLASRTISEENTPDTGGGHQPAWKRPKDDTHGPRMRMASPTWGVSLRRKRIAAIVPDRAPAMVDRNSNLDLLERPEGALRKQPVGGGDNEKTRRTASVSRGGGIIPGTGAGTEITIGMEDQVQQNRQSCSVGSRRALPSDSGGGGGGGDVHGGSVSAAVNEEDKFIAQASGQHVVCDTYLGEVPAILNAPPGDTLVNQPEMYSAQNIDLDGMPMEEVVVLEPLEFSAPDASLDSRPIAGNMDWNPSDYVVHNDLLCTVYYCPCHLWHALSI